MIWAGNSKSVAEIRFNCDYLNDYLAMVEETESPRLFHVWSAIADIAGALGRRCWFPFGAAGDIYPNHYILLVGTPGTRKSTASSQAKRVLADSTGVRFAPKDTGGQRQGLVVAMQGNTEQAKEFLGAAEVAKNSIMDLTLEDIAEITNDPEDERSQFISAADKHHLMLVSGEFGQFIGQNNRQLLDFLTAMWDGEDYEYQIKSGVTTLKSPLLNVLGATTPTSIAQNLPPQAGGQGFLSRVILVYGARKYRSVARPVAPAADLVARVKDHLQRAYYEIAGAFTESDAARDYSIGLYEYPLEISDSRFGYYGERRYTHLIKLAMCLAAGRGSQNIERDDYAEAHRILRATERGMPDALGEFGMNPLATLKQNMLEQIRQAHLIPLDVLQAMFHRDARAQEIMEVLNDLKRLNQIKYVQGKDGHINVHAVFQLKESTEEGMWKLLAET
jgi:hypothetical protein